MFTVEGLRWPRVIDYDITGEPSAALMAKEDNPANYVATQEIGISEHFEAQMPPFAAVRGGRDMTDYLYHFGTVDALWNGAWGSYSQL